MEYEVEICLLCQNRENSFAIFSQPIMQNAFSPESWESLEAGKYRELVPIHIKITSLSPLKVRPDGKTLVFKNIASLDGWLTRQRKEFSGFEVNSRK